MGTKWFPKKELSCTMVIKGTFWGDGVGSESTGSGGLESSYFLI